MTKAEPSERGLLGLMGILIGAGCLLVALVSVFNVAFDLRLALEVSGTSTALPRHYEEVIGLAAVGALLIALTLFGGLVRRMFAAAKGKPLARVGILAGAVLLLVVVGRALQVYLLIDTYGSMLAYYATDGDLADVEAELAKGPDLESLDRAVSRAAQYDNEGALALLLAAGADMRDSSRPEPMRHCALVGRSFDFVKVAIDHGVTPDACPQGQLAVWEAVNEGSDDAEVARTVTLLIAAGWSPVATPDHQKTPAAEIATTKKWPLTAQALAAAAN